jgi:hypothetical protein
MATGSIARAPRVFAVALSTITATLIVATIVQQRSTAQLRSRMDAAALNVPLPPLPANLPPPVRRYFAHAFPAGARPLRIARFHNSGTLRTDPSGARWIAFSATQQATPHPRAFLWDARIAHGLLRVVDRYADGHGAGRVRVLGAITVDGAQSVPALDAGALHRYLAEAVWYPSALWPGDGLSWTPIDARRARATLSDGHRSVSLEFRFAPDGAVQSVYTPGRWGRFGGRYRQVGWEGRFAGELSVQGVRVPARADVGWYVDGAWRPVWRGRIDGIEFDDGD